MFESNLNQRESPIEWTLWGAVGGLMLVGTLFIYSATSVSETMGFWQRFREMPFAEFARWLLGKDYFKQVLAYGMGVFAAIGICLVDYHQLARWSLVFYWLGNILLVAVIFFGKTVMGAKRWIDLGFFSLQPSEFAKLAFILVLANFLSRPLEELRSPQVFFRAMAMMMLPFGLILTQPDLGSALVLVPICLVMMFVAGTSRRYLKRLVGAGVILAVLMVVDTLFVPSNWQVLPLKDYQRHRLLVFFGKDFAPRNATPEQRANARRLREAKEYNVEQALISVGSGGLTGKGWRQGTQNALGYLPRPVAHNDFIFSVIAEEKGFLGSLTVLTLYTMLLFAGIKVAGQARDRLGRLMAVGVVAMLFSHVFVNIGMNISIMPVKGIPLPLLSYGGTSVLCSLIAAGILQNIYMYRRSY